MITQIMEVPYLSITWVTTEVTAQSIIALIKTIVLHCNGSKEITEIQQHILVKSQVWGGPQQPEAPCHSQVARTPRYEGLAIVTKTWGIGLSIY